MTTHSPEASRKEPLEAGLYIVATPIGNLKDITFRAIDVLARADVIACEDTRVTGKLLNHLGISGKLQRHDDHASDAARARLIETARTGAVALVSDAGTPLVSDPGYRLVREARAAGIPVTAIPGPCAAIAGVTLAGIEATLIFYETAPRLERALCAVAELWPTREVAVARELTKLYEECRRGTAAELADHYAAHPPKGEIVLMIGPPVAADPGDLDSDALLRAALEEMSPAKAAGRVAKATGLDRQTLYARAVELRGE